MAIHGLGNLGSIAASERQWDPQLRLMEADGLRASFALLVPGSRQLVSEDHILIYPHHPAKKVKPLVARISLNFGSTFGYRADHCSFPVGVPLFFPY